MKLTHGLLAWALLVTGIGSLAHSQNIGEGVWKRQASGDITSGLVHSWVMNDANVSGTTITDIGSSPLNGLANGGVTSAAGPGGQTARAFDGATGTGITASASPRDWNSGSFTWASWVWITNNAALSVDSQSQTYFYDDRAGNGTSYLLISNRESTPGGVNVQCSRLTSAASSVIVATTVVPSAGWTHLGYTNTGGCATGTPLFYVNGSSVSFTTPGSTDGSFDSIGTAWGTANTTTANLAGRMYKQNIYSRALSSADMLALFNSN